MAVLARRPEALSRVSLRSGFVLTYGALGLLAVLAASALLVIASLLHRNALHLTQATVREEIARDVELDLLMHKEIADLTAAGARTADLEDTQEKGIHEHFADAHRVAGSQKELSELEADVDSYFAVSRELERQGLPVGEVVAQGAGALEPALRKAGELRAAAQADVAHTRGDTRRIDHWVNGVALGLGAAVVLSILAFVVASRAFLVRPVRALGSTIHHFGSGDLSVRADERAPRELREVAQTFNQMASTIARQRDNELTSLACVAHDLNGPINVLGMLTEPRSVEQAVGSQDGLRRRLAMVHRQTERIQRIVRDLFDAVRAETGGLTLELRDHDLREVAQSSVELYEDVSKLHQLRLSTPPAPVLARCDPGRVEQALQNIIANAIKYSPQGGPVTVRVAIERSEAVLSVSDEGIGLGEDQRERIFDAFQRFGPPGTTGAGLGLSLVKRIVQAHGGVVEVDSVKGAGSTFRMRLPLAPPGSPA